MIGIIQRFGMATELSHRKKTSSPSLPSKKIFWKIGDVNGTVAVHVTADV